MQIPCVNDPELVLPFGRRRTGEIGGVEAVGDRMDSSLGELRHLLGQCPSCFRSVHDDEPGTAQLASHTSDLSQTVPPTRVDHHLIESPWIAKVRDPRYSKGSREEFSRWAGF